ncbi:MAG TPA: enoyl-CoA hydratase/isomerase family protein [Puia sp.]|nr:enoyl-CoA hydratase/isomerase family protein [Puia sp.]
MNGHSSGYVKAERHGHSMTIEFFHPQSNSLSGDLLRDLASRIHDAGLDAETHVILLRSAGERAFCAGASFDELSKIKTAREGEGFFNGFAHVLNSMRKCPKFIVARIQGKCVGGGVGLAAAADYAIALTGADIRLSELELGIGPFVIGAALERKIGSSFFSQLAVDASSWRTAEWAKSRGLFSEVHSTRELMDESVSRLIHHLSHSNPVAMREMKKMFWEGTSHWDHLLEERAKICGNLVAGEFAQGLIKKR